MFSVRSDLKKFQVSNVNIQPAEFFFEELIVTQLIQKFPHHQCTSSFILNYIYSLNPHYM